MNKKEVRVELSNGHVIKGFINIEDKYSRVGDYLNHKNSDTFITIFDIYFSSISDKDYKTVVINRNAIILILPLDEYGKGIVTNYNIESLPAYL